MDAAPGGQTIGTRRVGRRRQGATRNGDSAEPLARAKNQLGTVLRLRGQLGKA